MQPTVLRVGSLCCVWDGFRSFCVGNYFFVQVHLSSGCLSGVHCGVQGVLQEHLCFGVGSGVELVLWVFVSCGCFCVTI